MSLPVIASLAASAISPLYSALGVDKPKIAQSNESGKFLALLQQLSQSNPAQYKKVTGDLAKGFHHLADQATSAGAASQAERLNLLAAKLDQASSTGQLPQPLNSAGGA